MPRMPAPPGYMRFKDAVQILQENGVINDPSMIYHIWKERGFKVLKPSDMYRSTNPDAPIKKNERGFYKRDDVEIVIEDHKSLYMGMERLPEEGKFVFRPARLEDLPAEDEVAYINFGEGSKSPARMQARRDYLQANPFSTFHLYSKKQLMAFMNLIPLSHEAIIEFRKGIRGWTFQTSMIEQFEAGHRLECVIIDLATSTSIPPQQRNRYAGYLLHHIAAQLAEWAAEGVDIQTVDACGGTPEGRNILTKAGFQKTGVFQIPATGKPDVWVNREMYHLDVDTCDLPFLRSYKLALAEWKSQQGG